MNNPKLMAAEMLIQVQRFKEAETTLRQALAETPQDGHAHSLLGYVLSALSRDKEAVQEAEIGVRLAPNSPYAYRIRAHTLLKVNQIDPAMIAIEQAIRLNPLDASNYHVLGRIHVTTANWGKALEAAEQGLKQDPMNEGLINLRALVLVQMGRRGEAGAALKDVLSRNPENPLAHASQGWTMLEQNNVKQAIEHFREALRLAPNMRMAQSGIVEALKARNPLYRMLLQFTLAMLKLDNRTQWLVMIGGVIGFQYVRRLMNDNPELTPILAPLIALYVGFVIFTWTGSPIFNLLLRFDPLGRYALSQDAIMVTNWIALCIIGAVGLGVFGLMMAGEQRSELHLTALQALAMMIPASGVGQLRGAPRAGIVIALALGLLGLLALTLLNVISGNYEAANDARFYFILGTVAFTWIAVFIGRRT